VENESQRKTNRYGREKFTKSLRESKAIKELRKIKKSPHKPNRNPKRTDVTSYKRNNANRPKEIQSWLKEKSLSKTGCLMHKVTAGAPHPMKRLWN